MAEQQATFGDVVGMESVVPVRRHPDDMVVCDDGTEVAHRDAKYDCRGGAHRNDEDCHEANVGIVTDVLMDIDGWVVDYTTKNEDYASGYDCIVDDNPSHHADRVEEWIRNVFGDWLGHTDFDDIMDDLVEEVVEGIDGSYNCNELEYSANEYACYNGKGCCLDSFEIGEYEEQVDFENYPELQELHEQGILDDILDDVNCDVYVNRDRRREMNEETGRYECVGRETYDPYGHGASFYTYHYPGGQWHWSVHEDIMDELVVGALCKLYGVEL